MNLDEVIEIVTAKFPFKVDGLENDFETEHVYKWHNENFYAFVFEDQGKSKVTFFKTDCKPDNLWRDYNDCGITFCPAGIQQLDGLLKGIEL